MPVIKPLSDLRRHANRLSQLCHDLGEPIFLTRYGRGDMVVMSMATYQQLHAELERYAARRSVTARTSQRSGA